VITSRSNKHCQQQTNNHGGCLRQPEVTAAGTGGALAVCVRTTVGGEGCGTVEPARSDMSRVAAPNVHVYVAKFPVVVVLEEVRPTLTVNTTNVQTVAIIQAGNPSVFERALSAH